MAEPDANTMMLGLGLDQGSGDNESTETQPDDEGREQAEDDAIDAVFEAKDPAARRVAFRHAVELCAKGY